MKSKWGFLRETKAAAEKAGVDSVSGLHRTGLEEYLSAIFPHVKADEWVHDKAIPGAKKRVRPDYRCESLKLIVEFDGLPHYTNPDRILADDANDAFYASLGYKVVRIPYFIQLTNEAIETLFGVKVSEPMFDTTIPSLGSKGRNTPAYLCTAGIRRMAKDFRKFPEQYAVNVKALRDEDNEFHTGLSLLERVYVLH